ncbi:hypothetical protein TNCV_2713381 [Trichonephila clavipes]|nr:hypothetical protein TNCV_2713381 [Trichonephila clavipes]
MGTPTARNVAPAGPEANLNRRHATSPLMMIVEGEEGWVAFDPPAGCSPLKLGLNRTKAYCHLYGAQVYGQLKAYI